MMTSIWQDNYAAIALHLVIALFAGAIIGLERSYHGRPAGFRTHTLVCLAASLLMLVTLYQSLWLPGPLGAAVRMDPTRMAQGIATGIGFLGAGVIFKEGLTVRGLTTAASIWTTSAIGTLIGVGLYTAAFAATVLTLGVLTVFRWLEMRLPSFLYAYYLIRFDRAAVMPEEKLRALLGEHGFKISDVSYSLAEGGRYFEYRMSVRTADRHAVTRLARSLTGLEGVREFVISPTGE